MTIKVKIGEAYDPRKRPVIDEDAARVQRALLPSPPKPPGFTPEAVVGAALAVAFIMIVHGLMAGWLL
jgi:hypothetical protein